MRFLGWYIVVQFCNLCNFLYENMKMHFYSHFFAKKFGKSKMFIVSLSSKSEINDVTTP